MAEKVKWACPECGMDDRGQHEDKAAGMPPAEDCKYAHASSTCGFFCECEEPENKANRPDHGTAINPCYHARCYHCELYTMFPQHVRAPDSPPPNTTDWPAWAKTAHEAGWTPPENWKP